MRLVAIIEYDGQGFSGWQCQPHQPTVQGEIETALQAVIDSAIKKAGRDESFVAKIRASGRTDTGVHARGQVADFDIPDGLVLEPNALRRAINALTPHAIYVRDLQHAPPDFSSRRLPHHKHYRYTLLLRDGAAGYFYNRAWAVGAGLNLKAMMTAASLFEGTHDFEAFRGSSCTASSTKRTLLVSELVRIENDVLTYSTVGKGFLKNMVRFIVGSIVSVGRGRISVDELEQLLVSPERGKAGPLAPGCGLTLEWVRYV